MKLFSYPFFGGIIVVVVVVLCSYLKWNMTAFYPMVAYEMGFTCQLNENAEKKQARERETVENYDESIEYLFLYVFYPRCRLVLPFFSTRFTFSLLAKFLWPVTYAFLRARLSSSLSSVCRVELNCGKSSMQMHTGTYIFFMAAQKLITDDAQTHPLIFKRRRRTWLVELSLGFLILLIALRSHDSIRSIVVTKKISMKPHKK